MNAPGHIAEEFGVVSEASNHITKFSSEKQSIVDVVRSSISLVMFFGIRFAIFYFVSQYDYFPRHPGSTSCCSVFNWFLNQIPHRLLFCREFTPCLRSNSSVLVTWEMSRPSYAIRSTRYPKKSGFFRNVVEWVVQGWRAVCLLAGNAAYNPIKTNTIK